jgi:hypothetical protein
MKRSKIFLAFGTLVLAVTAVFATKANKKFALQHTGYIRGATSLYVIFTQAVLTKTNPTGTKAIFATLYTASAGHHEAVGTLVNSSGSQLFFE